jgi:hypothetical protein
MSARPKSPWAASVAARHYRERRDTTASFITRGGPVGLENNVTFTLRLSASPRMGFADGADRADGALLLARADRPN